MTPAGDRVLRVLLVVWIAVSLWIVFCEFAAAQGLPPNCGPRAQVTTAMTGIGQRLQMAGLHTRAGELFEIWANPDTGAWSALATMAIAVTCIVAGGESFALAPAAPADVPG